MQQHTNGVAKLYKDNIRSDSFASYLIKHLKHLRECAIKAKDVKPLLNVDVVSKLNPISVSRKFRTKDCQLCMQKKIEITQRWLRGKKSMLINKNNKIY